jgi:hypothetical protein
MAERLRMVVAVLRPSEPSEGSFVKSERRFAEYEMPHERQNLKGAGK